MTSTHQKKVFKRREHSIARWGGEPMQLPWGVNPSDELFAERKAYLQSLLPEHLREGYTKEPKPVTDDVRKKKNKRVRGEYVGRTKGQVTRSMYNTTKSRAKAKGVPFDIEITDIVIPDFCPVLGIPLESSGKITDNTPSIDKLVPTLGYVKGNINVISFKANRIKNDSTPEELEAVLSWVKSVLE